MRRPFPTGYSDTNRGIIKDRTGPDPDEHPLYFSMSPKQGIPADISDLAEIGVTEIGVSSFNPEKIELPSREGAPGGLNRASGFPFPL